MNVAITGGTGTVGREVTKELARRGHAVRVLTRGVGGWLPAGATHHRVDLATGAGLDAALAGVDVVVDASNAGPDPAAAEAVLVDGGRRLLAAARAAGVAHHVGVSIVGIDRVPAPYYRVKLAQEEVIRGGGVPWTIVRATQFHDLVASVFAGEARISLLADAAFPLQPVDVREVAVVLADTAEAEPSGAITQFAGPEVRTVRELAETWRLETGRPACIAPVPVPDDVGEALRAGGLTNPGAWKGRVAFGEWLRERAPAALEGVA